MNEFKTEERVNDTHTHRGTLWKLFIREFDCSIRYLRYLIVFVEIVTKTIVSPVLTTLIVARISAGDVD